MKYTLVVLIFTLHLSLQLSSQDAGSTKIQPIDIQISYIDAPLINIHWCADTVLALTSKGSIYRSDDKGRQWVKMSEVFHRKALVQLEDSDEKVSLRI